jgi:hypothetical protein
MMRSCNASALQSEQKTGMAIERQVMTVRAAKLADA